jgi:hypothetical protein
MDQKRLSLRFLLRQREEIEKDLTAFKQAFDILRGRLRDAAEVKDVPPLSEWSGMRAVMGSLELSIFNMEREHSDYTTAIHLVREGKIENVDDDVPKPPVLKLVPEEQ